MSESILKVYNQGEPVEIGFDGKAKLSDLLASAGITVEMPCGGNGTCIATATAENGHTANTPAGGWQSASTYDEFKSLITNTPANGSAYDLDEEISYRITVKNDGNQTITGIEVKDDLTGESWKVDSLAPGESKEFTTTYKVTEEDRTNGSVKNVATATGTDPDDKASEVEPGEAETPVKQAEAPSRTIPDSSWALLNLLAMLGTVGTGLGMLITMFKKKKKAKGEAQPTKETPAEKQAEEAKPTKWKLIGTALAAASVVTFFLTENLSSPMVVTDKWTILMAGILLVAGVAAFFTRTKKNKGNADKKSAEQPTA